MLRKCQILSTLHQFPSKMYITYLPSHIHTIFKRFSPPTCLLDFTFCPSSMFIPSNMFIRFCLFALPTLLFHPTRLLGTLEYTHFGRPILAKVPTNPVLYRPIFLNLPTNPMIGHHLWTTPNGWREAY